MLVFFPVRSARAPSARPLFATLTFSHAPKPCVNSRKILKPLLGLHFPLTTPSNNSQISHPDGSPSSHGQLTTDPSQNKATATNQTHQKPLCRFKHAISRPQAKDFLTKQTHRTPSPHPNPFRIQSPSHYWPKSPLACHLPTHPRPFRAAVSPRFTPY